VITPPDGHVMQSSIQACDPPSPQRERRRSFCRFCGSACAIIATVEGDRILEIEGDREDPISRGYICPKGSALAQFHHHPQRLDRPRIKSNGQVTEVDWPTALDDLAVKLRQVIETHGTSAIGSYAGTPTVPCSTLSVWRTFMGNLKTPQIYSTISIDVACAPLVGERITGQPMLTGQPDLSATMTILIGVNPMVSHGHVFFIPAPKAHLRQWASQGQLWVIDPKRTESAAAASRHLAPWPGSEFLLLGHVVRELLREGADRDFLNAEVSGLDKLSAAVERFTLEEVIAGTRLRADEITEFVTAVRQAGRVAIHCGTGISLGKNANVTTFLMWALHAVTGSLDRPGGAYFNPGFVRNLNRAGWEPMNTTGPGPKSRPDLPSRLGEYPCAALADEIESGHLKALFIFAGNPVIALPDTQRLVAALSKLDVLVIIDVVETASTPLATHLLPSVGQLETADFVSFDFISPWEYTRYAPRVVKPAAERKPLWWILAELSRRVGIESGLPAQISEDDDVLRPMMSGARATFEEVRSSPTAITSPQRTYGWVRQHLPEGRWNLAPLDLLEQLAGAEVCNARWLLVAHRQRNKLNSQMSDGLARPRKPDRAALFMHPLDAAELGVAEGDLLEIATNAGRVTAPVRFDGSWLRGIVSLPHGFGELNVNMLTDARNIDPLSGMVTLGGFPVSLTKVIERDRTVCDMTV
jgi:anaerobic selenocysteine-containing dehydrogenase